MLLQMETYDLLVCNSVALWVRLITDTLWYPTGLTIQAFI